MEDGAVQIREGVLDDAELIAGHVREIAWETEALTLDHDEALEAARKALQSPSVRKYFLLAAHRQVVGQVSIEKQWVPWRNSSVWWIHSVYVKPEYRGRGFFRLLHHHVHQKATEQGIEMVKLCVHGRNKRATGIYENLGMKRVRKQFYPSTFLNGGFKNAHLAAVLDDAGPSPNTKLSFLDFPLEGGMPDATVGVVTNLSSFVRSARRSGRNESGICRRCPANGSILAMEDGEVQIREGVLEDAELIAGHVRAIACETESITLDPEVTLEASRTILQNPSLGIHFLLTVDGQVVGQLLIKKEWMPWRNAFAWWIQSVYVKPDYRGRGFFRVLLEHVRQKAKDQGVEALKLQAHDENKRAIAVYEKLGMEQRGRVFEAE